MIINLIVFRIIDKTIRHELVFYYNLINFKSIISQTKKVAT